MIFYRLNDDQVRNATTSLALAPFVLPFLALKIAEQGRVSFALGFIAVMAVLLSLIIVQIIQSRRLNTADREGVRG